MLRSSFSCLRFGPYIRSVILAVTLVVHAAGNESSWPTQFHDNQRSGRSAASVALPLSLHWTYHTMLPPRPSWPDPAKQDFWNRKQDLLPRVTYDRAFHLVSDGDYVLFGSSADDQIRCLDLKTGQLRWRFFAEAPIRCAPTLHQGIAFFGADDGFLYSIDIATGSLRWKASASDGPVRWIPGNGRIISQYPVRTGVLLHGDVGYFAAGLFPKFGATHGAFELASGKILKQTPLDVTTQGPLEIRDGRIFAHTGRNPAGAFIASLQRRGVELSAESRDVPSEYAYGFAATNDLRFMGGDGKVAALSATSAEVQWQSQVQGKAYSLILLDGRLLVSTDTGHIYCFGDASYKRDVVHNSETPSKPTTPDDGNDLHLGHAVSSLPSRHGYALVVDDNVQSIQRRIRTLLDQTAMQIVALVPDEISSQIRTYWFERGVYGRRVVVHSSEDPQATQRYAASIFNLAIGADRRSMLPLVRPGGIAVDQAGVDVRAKPVSYGDWTHMYANAGNTACSTDTAVDHHRLQWFGEPGPRAMVDRHLRTMPALCVDGRLYVPALDRIIAVDAFNGAPLWQRNVPGMTRVGVLKDCGFMAADATSVFVSAGGTCLSLDAWSGEPQVTWTLSNLAADWQDREWGALLSLDDQLIGSVTPLGAARRTIDRSTILEAAYSDNRPIVCSESIFACPRDAAEITWRYDADGSIPHPSIAANGRHVFLVRSEFDSAQSAVPGRTTWDVMARDNTAEMVALDKRTGRVTWKRALTVQAGVQNLYSLFSDQFLVVVHSFNQTTVHYDIRVFHTEDGSLVWHETIDSQKKIGGDHGEQDKHPLIVDNRLIVEPVAFELDSGRSIADFSLNARGYGCGTLSASLSGLFFRSGNPACYQFHDQQIQTLTKTTRPGCWINIIPASGLLLIPESSSGCTCNFPIQTSLALAPAK